MIAHAWSQHRWQVGHSHSISPSAPRGWVAPHKLLWRHVAVFQVDSVPLTGQRKPRKRMRVGL